MSKNNFNIETNDGSIIFLFFLSIILFVLKVFKIIEIEWVIVLSPLWLPSLLLVGVLMLTSVCISIYEIYNFIKNKVNKK